jgi:hypothetical protein
MVAEAEAPLRLAVDDRVVYASHGIGRIESRQLQGTPAEALTLVFEGGLTVTPCVRCPESRSSRTSGAHCRSTRPLSSSRGHGAIADCRRNSPKAVSAASPKSCATASIESAGGSSAARRRSRTSSTARLEACW